MVTDKERFRYLMAHPDYWTNDSIRKEADEIGKKLWKNEERGRKILVSMNGSIVMQGTAEHLSKRCIYSAESIRNFVRKRTHDRFGKFYQYEEDVLEQE